MSPARGDRTRRDRTLIAYPRNRLLAVIDDPAHASEAVAALVAAGFAEGDVELLAGDEGRDRLGRLGSGPARLPRVLRLIQFVLMDQLPDFLVYERAIEDGRAVIAVRIADRATTGRARKTLDACGAHFLNAFGRFTTEELTMWRGDEPGIRDALRR